LGLANGGEEGFGVAVFDGVVLEEGWSCGCSAGTDARNSTTSSSCNLKELPGFFVASIVSGGFRERKMRTDERSVWAGFSVLAMIRAYSANCEIVQELGTRWMPGKCVHPMQMIRMLSLFGCW
jgi:hypothetical protein